MLWFRRKPKNRRLGRQHVLDVKLRSSKVRAARIRMAAVALSLVFAIVFGVFLLWRAGQLALDRLLYQNKAFAIQNIEIETDGDIAIDQLRRWAGIKTGGNLLALDLARVKRDLELVPLIKTASVERILPHTLRLRVQEREALARINVPRPRSGGGVELGVFHLDPEGYIMLPLDPRQRATPATEIEEEYPILSGINPNYVQPGRRLDATQVKAALEFLLAFQNSSMAGLVELKRVDLAGPDILLVTTGQGSEITLGLGDFDQQIRRWREIFERGQHLGKAIATLDLAITNNIPARWSEITSVPPNSPKPPKPIRNRKKHV